METLRKTWELQPFFENLVDCMTEELFLQEFSRKYHYEKDQMELLVEVAASMQRCIRQDNDEDIAGWKAGMPLAGGVSLMCPVCITLGSRLDMLQEDYLDKGLLTEAYMIETLGSEILLKAYPQWNAWVRNNSHTMMEQWRRQDQQEEYAVRRYHFLGSEETCPEEMYSEMYSETYSEMYSIKALPQILEQLQVPVTCTEAYCMLPKKSVVFYAELVHMKSCNEESIKVHSKAHSKEHSRAIAAADNLGISPEVNNRPSASADIDFCEGICAGCRSANCPNRMEKKSAGFYAADMTDPPFTYGYSRIFGLR